jgi:hypothetical protein
MRIKSFLLLFVVSVSLCCGFETTFQLPEEYAGYVNEGLERDFQAMLMQQERDTAVLRRHGSNSTVPTETYDPSSDDDDILNARFLQSDIAFCYDALYLADQNKDSKVNGNEFVTFVQIMGPPGFLPDADTFNDLPLIMQSNFIILACLCLQLPGANPQCCTQDPHIDNTGTWPGQVPTPQQQQYLYQVCFLTETSIDRVIASQTPTVAPESPTDPPVPEPTEAPVAPPTEAPVVPPTEPPSVSPTIATPAPTMVPVPTDPPTDPIVPTTESPSSAPSVVTDAPVVVTDAPVAPNTTAPTPGFVITAAPTTAPPTDGVPSVAPSSMAPAVAPSRPTVRPPTPTRTPDAGSLGPSLVPPLVSDQVVQVNYEIGLRNGNTDTIEPSFYVPSLAAAMDALAVSVEESFNANQMLAEEEDQQNQQGSDPPQEEDVGSNDNPGQVDLSDPSVSRLGDNRNLRRRPRRRASFVQAAEMLEGEAKQPTPQGFRRRLAVAVEVDLPSEVVGTIDEACPDFVPSSDSCQNVAATVPLIVYLTGDEATEEEAEATRAFFTQELDSAIADGKLQDALEEIDPNSVVYITTGASAVPPPPSGVTDDVTTDPKDSEGLNAGAITGITVGCAAVVILAGVLLTRRRPRKEDEDDEVLLKDAEDKTTAEQLSKDIAAAEAKNLEDEAGPDPATTAAAVGGAVGAAAAVPAVSTRDSSQKDDYMIAPTGSSSPGKKKRFTSGALYEVPGTKNITSDEGSSAGESGWSSNQDMSSVDSKSLDSGAGQIAYVGGGIGGAAALAGAAGVAAAHSSESSSRGGATPEDSSITPSRDYSADASLQSTYSELDEAIQKGDWAAVGVTAALLASQSHDEGSTQGSRPHGINKKASLNPQRAAELDALVEAGDWEGVVAAAARFDAQEALRGESTTASGGAGSSRSRDSPSGGSVGGSSIGTGPSFMTSGTLESTTSPSTFTAGNTATSDTASTRSKARKLNEIREEVEALVNAVVPEEADNVDEMMTQFRGREEELVETLRSMQERQVAQKARLESQKQAKRDAKAFVETQKQQEKNFGAVDNTGNAADDQWMAELDTSETKAGARITALAADAQTEKDIKQQLKEAIEKEDWNNVAAAAAGLSGHGIFHDDDENTSYEGASTSSGRSVEINALVDRGDWDGVVAAASRYAGAASQKTDGSTSIEERRRKRQERLKEEEEALAQAEIWDAIAEQTKAENQEEEEKASNAGANLAAAWAIDRSLTALRKAETDKSEGSQRSSEGGGEV